MVTLKNSVIVWKPGTNEIGIVGLGENFPEGFFSWGACNAEVFSASISKRKRMLVNKYLDIILTHRVDPTVAYRVFCRLREFAPYAAPL